MRERLSAAWKRCLVLIGGVVAVASLIGARAPVGVRGQVPPTAQPTPAAQPVAGRVTYPQGWNLVAGPPGTVLTGTDGPLYTLQANSTAYQVVDPSTPLQPGVGYWAQFDTLTPEIFPSAGPESVRVQLPAGHYVLIGNPRNSLTLVTGADAVYVYDPVLGYEQTMTLVPGQGAWAFSYTGATATISNVSP